MERPPTELEKLVAELHEVNLDFADAARPLQSLDELSLEEREHLGDRLRARLARWESIRQKISKCLERSN